MRNLPIIIGLPSNGKLNNLYQHLTRTNLFNFALIFFGLLSMLLFFLLIHQHNKHEIINQYCLNEECLLASTYQLDLMNKSGRENRCRDFYNYACGGWEQTHSIESTTFERTIFSDMIDERNTHLYRLLNTPIIHRNSRSWEWKVKTYYLECLDDYARLPDSGKVLLGLIQLPDSLNGWFLFDHDQIQFQSKNQTVFEQVLFVHGELGANPLYGIHAQFDHLNPSLKRLEFYPTGLSMGINDYINNDTISERRRSIYRFYILEILALLAQDADVNDDNLNNRMFTIANDIIAMEKILAEFYDQNQNETTINMTLLDMSRVYSFDFVKYITLIFGQLSETTSVYITNPTYFEKTFFFLSSNNNNILITRLIHNYLRWQLVQAYINDLSYNYIHKHRIFLDNYYNQSVHTSNDAYCLNEVIRRFPLAIQRLYTMDTANDSETINLIQRLFGYLKDGLKEFVDQRINDSKNRKLKEKIDSLTISIGYANMIFNDEQLDQYYEKLIIDDKSHFENAYNYHRFYQWTIYNSLLNPSELDYWDFFQTKTDEFFDYIEYFHRIFLIGYATHQPLIHSQWPWSMNLGSLGVLLAEKMLIMIDRSMANQTSNALRIAYLTLKQRQYDQSLKMLATNLTFEQTFFLAHVQTQCYHQRFNLERKKSFLNTMLFQMPEFIENFHCMK